MDGRTDGGDDNAPSLFLKKKRGDNYRSKFNILKVRSENSDSESRL